MANKNINNAAFRAQMQEIDASDLLQRLAIGAENYMLISSEPDEMKRFDLAIALAAQSMAIYLETQGVLIPEELMADFGLEPC